MAEILNIGNIMTPDKPAGAEKEAERSLNGSRGSKDKKDLEPSLQIGKKLEVPIWHKTNLTLEETAAYSGIGINKLRQIRKTVILFFSLAGNASSSAANLKSIWRSAALSDFRNLSL